MIGATEALEESPSIQATSSSATATGCFAIVHNYLTHTAIPRWSRGELSDPLPSPPTSLPLAREDDAPAPSDPDLILRPTLKRTNSGVMSR